MALLVAENPLAWIFLHDSKGPFATAAPVRPVTVDGEVTKLVGRVPRNARIAACLQSAREGLLLFLGPHGYVSPSWMSDRTQAPTWNFTSVQFAAEMGLVEDPAFLEQHLRDLTGAMEQDENDQSYEEIVHGLELDGGTMRAARMQKLAGRA